MFFFYGEKELTYLKNRDKRLGVVIETVGFIRRPVDADLFSSVVHHIVGQQISSKAQATVWKRLDTLTGGVSAETLVAHSVEELQRCGMTFRKAEHIRAFAEKVRDGRFDPEAVRSMSDEDAIAALSSLDGVGVWTAEMILLFCLERPDVLSYGDLAIHRGLRMIYRHKTIDRARFERYRKRFSPCGSVASLYLWAAAGGAVPGLTDPAFPGKKERRAVKGKAEE